MTLESARPTTRGGVESAATAWLRAIELTAPISRYPQRTLPAVIEEIACRNGGEMAVLSDGKCLTYSELAARSRQFARWALAQNVLKGETVCLVMQNCPDYLAVWLGITSIGGVVALINTNLQGGSLAHSINIVKPRHAIVSAELAEEFEKALPSLTTTPVVWVHGEGTSDFARIDDNIACFSGGALDNAERRPVTIADTALYIYTSGTTGLPKAAKVSHARILQWSYWFAGIMDAQPCDRLYNCLPMYHSVGGVLAPGAILAAGGALVVSERFSASHFWGDLVRWECTIVQYIGELCRYLLQSPPAPESAQHKIRIACGNGLRPDVWDEFKGRFRIPRILEFYASTEGGVSLFNVLGRPGSIGSVPPYLVHRFSPALVKYDVETEELVRDEGGFCVRCAANEVGEAIGQVSNDPATIGTQFEGYLDEAASTKKVLRNVFKPGDAWVRTGDLMRRDEKGFFYFVDRAGDTFRWKGENVATLEVSEAISEFPGVKHSNVYGVSVPGTDGRAGMAMLVTETDFDLVAFRAHLTNRLPKYARPLFLRLRDEMKLSGTLKYVKRELVGLGFDPSTTEDDLYFDCADKQMFVKLDESTYTLIQSGRLRL